MDLKIQIRFMVYHQAEMAGNCSCQGMTRKAVFIMMLRKLAVVLALMLLVTSSAMAETVVDTIMNVGTTQAFTDEAVSIDDLNTIMQAGLSAASAINQQPWFFVAVTNQELMTEIAGSGMGFTPPAGAQGMPGGTPQNGNGSVPGAPGAPGSAPQSGNGSFPAAPAASGGAKAGLGDSPAAIIIYRNDASKSPNADFDCGLAAQNMVIAASSLGYGVKIVSSPTMSLNGQNHDALCEKLGVDPSMQAVAVLLIGYADNTADTTSSATTREALEAKTNIIE